MFELYLDDITLIEILHRIDRENIEETYVISTNDTNRV